MDANELKNRALELTDKARAIKTPEEAQAFALDAVAAFRDAKEELAKVDASSILGMLLPFLPTRWRPLVGTLTAVLGLFGSGFGFSQMTQQPEAINVTIPAETQAQLDEQAAKLAEATKAADEAADKQRETFDAAIGEMQAAQEAMKAAAAKRFVIRGVDKDNRTVTELDFFKQ